MRFFDAGGEKILPCSGIIAEKLIVSPLERGASEGGGVCLYSPPKAKSMVNPGSMFDGCMDEKIM